MVAQPRKLLVDGKWRSVESRRLTESDFWHKLENPNPSAPMPKSLSTPASRQNFVLKQNAAVLPDNIQAILHQNSALAAGLKSTKAWLRAHLEVEAAIAEVIAQLQDYKTNPDRVLDVWDDWRVDEDGCERCYQVTERWALNAQEVLLDEIERLRRRSQRCHKIYLNKLKQTVEQIPSAEQAKFKSAIHNWLLV